jgi:hypothetical protein
MYSDEIVVSLGQDKPIEIMYSKSNVEMLLNHLLSKQKLPHQWAISGTIDVDVILNECKMFGFNLIPEGKNINE